jgi:hypothetical protein
LLVASVFLFVPFCALSLNQIHEKIRTIFSSHSKMIPFEASLWFSARFSHSPSPQSFDHIVALMRRRETSDEREAQLDAWDRRLEERQRELDSAIAEFRADVRRETARLLEKEEQLLARAKDLKGREEVVTSREASVFSGMTLVLGVVSSNIPGLFRSFSRKRGCSR